MGDNVSLDYTAEWNDPTGDAGMRDAVENALKTYAPTAQHQLNDLAARL
jgi:hypothetical protein